MRARKLSVITRALVQVKQQNDLTIFKGVKVKLSTVAWKLQSTDSVDH